MSLHSLLETGFVQSVVSVVNDSRRIMVLSVPDVVLGLDLDEGFTAQGL